MDYEIKFTLRIMESKMEKLRKIAENNLRSVNKEIEYIINNYIEENKEVIEKASKKKTENPNRK